MKNIASGAMYIYECIYIHACEKHIHICKYIYMYI